MAAAVHVYLLRQPPPRVPPPPSAASSTRSLLLAVALPPLRSSLRVGTCQLPSDPCWPSRPTTCSLSTMKPSPSMDVVDPSTGKHGWSRWRSSPEHYALKASTTPPRAQVQSSPELQIQMKAQCCIVDWHIRGNQQTIKLQMISPRSGRLVEVHSETFISVLCQMMAE
ncbi:uncharacterized protein LOC125544310 isoform X2 [Triticum urartu]|uniref:uncharacterized protein LOC125510404 isoform X2 n=1 Tax=Triticum urartu TaxID=4572 RepID=UPI002044A6CE|nr:uncharacterized protein LOC125510404 isoform X2 [Triticum urartu]XP_048563895.1 uncharacterized protein LOC125544310 isoform X2 [Triticum urartu]